MTQPPPFSDSNRRERQERRRTSWKSFFYGGVLGRRQGSRRNDDVNHYTDVYDSQLLFASAGIVVLCCWDAHLTLNMLAHGGKELNPFMDILLWSGPDLFLYVKIALTICCVLFLALHHRFPIVGGFRVQHILCGLLLGYVALIAYELVLWSPHWLAPIATLN
jgi:hypothetical protein